MRERGQAEKEGQGLERESRKRRKSGRTHIDKKEARVRERIKDEREKYKQE